MYDYILFDFDGTVADTKKGIINAARYALEKYGIRPSTDELKRFIGPSLWYSFENFYGFDRQKQDEAVAYYREYYFSKGMYEASLYEGMLQTLKKIKDCGKIMAIASVKLEKSVREALAYLNAAEYFDVIKGSLPDGSGSDKALLINEVLDELNLKNSGSSVYVGDSITDYQGAVSLGIPFIAALYDRDISHFDGAELNMKAYNVNDILNFI